MEFKYDMITTEALKAGSTYEAWGSKVHVLTSQTNIVDIGTQNLLQIITPILNKNGKTYIDIRDTIESEASLLMTTRGFAYTIVDELCLDKKQTEEILNDKYYYDFMKVVNKIEAAMAGNYHKTENTIYFVTLPKYTSQHNIDFCTTTYGIKYNFTFYKPYIFDTYNVKYKIDGYDKYKQQIDYYSKMLKMEPDWPTET